jgi:hypothetical protein
MSLDFKVQKIKSRNVVAMPQLRQLVVGFSRRRTGFAPKLFRVEFVVDKVAVARGFIPILSVFSS